jgi:hypothetical protein
MYADFKGAFNSADHRIMFKHMRHRYAHHLCRHL